MSWLFLFRGLPPPPNRRLFTLPNQALCHILVKMSNLKKFFFAFSNVKSLSECVVKILALKFELKKSYGRKTKISLCKNALIGPDLA